MLILHERSGPRSVSDCVYLFIFLRDGIGTKGDREMLLHSTLSTIACSSRGLVLFDPVFGEVCVSACCIVN